MWAAATGRGKRTLLVGVCGRPLLSLPLLPRYLQVTEADKRKVETNLAKENAKQTEIEKFVAVHSA